MTVTPDVLETDSLLWLLVCWLGAHDAGVEVQPNALSETRKVLDKARETRDWMKEE